MNAQNNQSPFWVVIPAAGVGSRMQVDTPKQYLVLQGKTILEHTVDCFRDLEGLAGIVIVVGSRDTYWTDIHQRLLSSLEGASISLHYTFGGDERAESVRCGLKFLTEKVNVSPNHWVMVHDAARPCVKLSNLYDLLAVRSDENYNGGILATPVRDTLKLSTANNIIDSTQPREALWQAQTPQLFKLGELYQGLRTALENNQTVTDEASVIESVLGNVKLVEGSSDNIKLTSPADLAIIDFLLSRGEG